MLNIVQQLEAIKRMVSPQYMLRGEPFQVLIKTILSHRTKDEITDVVSMELFRHFPDSQTLKNADRQEIEKIIRPTGFYSVKAERIIEVARIIDEEYNGKVPDTRHELITLPGVGPKTANCVLVYAFGKDAIPVDTHVHRIANRLAWVKTSSPEKTEEALVKVVPRSEWADLNEIVVTFGKNICRPISPRCGACELTESCQYYRSSRKKENHIDKS